MFQAPLNGHTPTIVTLFLSDQSAWLSDLPARLHNLHYDTLVARTVDDAWSLLRTQQPDALVAAGDCDASLKLYSAICDCTERDQRPLLVLACDTPPTPALNLDDVLLFPIAFPFFEHQLRTFLSLRAANHQLRRTNSDLLTDNRRLKQDVMAHQSRNDEVNLLKNAIVRNVSHELRTPLLQMKSAVSLLAEDVGRDNKLIEYATGATARLEGVVRNITLLNELLNESMDVHTPTAVMVSEMIEYAIRNLRRSWEHKDQIDRIRVQLDDNLPPVLADKQGIATVLQLLLDNALKFSQQPVDITAHRDGGYVVISTTDYGIGIPADKLEKIFESFYQIDNSSTRRYGGMGIGLAIVRFILDRHQTRIEVDSEEGQGSTFRFALPIAELR
ncbi:MAG: HAMP domain-containing histidine kinase [Chloroflexi bacterium]|nr:HAMP domain-containing histidine kinase [Chloroflexota bacterium]